MGLIKIYITKFNEARSKEGFHLVPDNWNDYLFYTLFNVEYIDKNLKKTEIGDVKIGFEDQTTDEKTRTVLNQLVSGRDDFLLELPNKFFSLGQSAKYYKNIKELDDDLRIDFLTAINDIAYNDELMKKYSEQEVLTVSLMREVNKYNYENQFKRIARGGTLLTDFDFLFSLEYQNKKKNLHFKVEPDTLPPTNLHAVIGTNGVGKTTVLKGIMNEYINGKLQDDFANLVYISFSVFDKNPSDEEDEKDSFFYVGLKKKLGKTKSDTEINEEFRDSILSILIRKKQYHLHQMFTILNKADYNFNKLNFITTLERYFETRRDKEDMQICTENIVSKFEYLSSGHKVILLSISKIVELIVEKSLVLIDEPETHLHPPLLSAYIRCLSELLTAENGVGIVATHSPVVLQEVPKSVVSIIRKYGNAFKIERPRIETFGENTGILTEEVFGLELINTGFHKILKEAAENLRDYDLVLEEFNHQLSLDAKTIVRSYLNELEKDTNDV
ncbi:AAA family ATPase [Exiguobacterium sp. s193]|uniref:AAA family ATPase n=1 Tax=Exiguobacterium sp. s193 TaxID=2751207 RepID=UPI001BEAAAFE